MYFIYSLLYLRGLIGSAAAQAELGDIYFFYILGVPIGIVASIALVFELFSLRSLPVPTIFSTNSIGYFINLLVPLSAWFLIWHI